MCKNSIAKHITFFLTKVKKTINFSPSSAIFLILFAFPASTNYRLRTYEFGAGGEDNASSTNYRANVLAGEVGDNQLSGTTYNLGPGLNFAQQADVPTAPTFTNSSNYYDKLHFIVNPSDNPTDATFAIAISDDSFSTTNYIQDDNTVGSTLGAEDYQTYAAWGGVSGQLVIGLDPNTNYEIKVKAMHGDFTETGYGPTDSAATIGPTIGFDLDISSSDTETSAPYIISMGELSTTGVNDSSEYIWIDFETNANSGGSVFIKGENAGLAGNNATNTIASVTGDLSSLSEGTGIQNSSVTQSNGGPLSVNSPYNGGGENVGIVDTTYREILTSANPIVGGRASFTNKVKINSIVPAAPDYTETMTIVAAGSF